MTLHNPLYLLMKRDAQKCDNMQLDSTSFLGESITSVPCINYVNTIQTTVLSCCTVSYIACSCSQMYIFKL